MTGFVGELRRAIRGEVRDDPQARAMYARDASNYRQVPRAVATPHDVDDVRAIVAACARYGVPITCRGGGTGLAGQTVGDGIVLDFSRHMNAVVAVDPERRLARVQPGVVLDQLRDATLPHGLTFGPDPATHSRCTLGGMLGNDSCGVHSVLAGRTADNVARLRIVTSDGECFWVGGMDDGPRPDGLQSRAEALLSLRDRYAEQIRQRFPHIPRRVSGYNLDELLPEKGVNVARSLVGSEGTCVIVVEAELVLVPWPKCRALVVLGYPSVYEAADHVPEILRCRPIGLEGVDAKFVQLAHKSHAHEKALAALPKGGGWLFVEVGGDSKDEARAAAERVAARVRQERNPPNVDVYADPEHQRLIWEVREASLAITEVTDGKETWQGFEDSAVSPEQLSGYLHAFRELLERYGYHASLYGHFGGGCVHNSIDFDLRSPAGIAKWKSFMFDAAELVTSYGGSLSGEHGDGQQRAQLLPIMFGPELVEAFGEFKRIWDPIGILNPGKIVDPPPIDEHLAQGPTYHLDDPPTVFRYPRDSFAWEATRCVGVGACRQGDVAVMCPSYKVLRVEEHCTRGRARLLQEMLRHDSPIQGEWRSDAVADALDLCLSCKACRTECPMNVDMARMKAEFVHQRYRGRIRPRSAYALGLMPLWAQLARPCPELVNGALGAPLLGRALKWAAGVSQERDVPRFAPRTFRSWWRGRRRRKGGRPVLLWIDTWTEHFRPEVGIAAVEALEDLGDEVHVLSRPVCCARPLYEHGLLRTARRWLERASAEAIAAGDMPVVFLEPSCHSAFRDELLDFWPDDPARKGLHARIRTFAEHVRDRMDDGRLPWRFAGHVVVHGHCHQRSGTGLEADEAVLDALGARHEVASDGCCGMAGSFGYEPRKVPVSLAIAEQEGFLPAMRGAGTDTALVVDGFSCGSQLTDRTDRRPLHLAQLVTLGEWEGLRIEDAVARRPGPSARRLVATAAAAAALVGLFAWARRR